MPRLHCTSLQSQKTCLQSQKTCANSVWRTPSSDLLTTVRDAEMEFRASLILVLSAFSYGVGQQVAPRRALAQERSSCGALTNVWRLAGDQCIPAWALLTGGLGKAKI